MATLSTFFKEAVSALFITALTDFFILMVSACWAASKTGKA
jgi:hypothetical protein